MLSVVTGGLTGLALGVRHALEPDHLAAVSTLVAERPGARRGLWLGAAWGLGHTLSLLIVGLALSCLHVTLPPKLAEIFELAVAAMLIFLGARAMLLGLGASGGGIAQANAHADAGHFHPDSGDHVHFGRLTLERRSLLVGLVHGLAGSGALTALVLPGLPTTSERLGYIALFGLGSIIGMALLSSLAGWPLERLVRARRIRLLSGAAGLVAVTVGVAWGWPIVARWI